jgi:hypothetical protein
MKISHGRMRLKRFKNFKRLNTACINSLNFLNL